MPANRYAMLDFDLGAEIDMLRDSVRDFADAEIAPRAAEIDRDDAFPARPVAEARRARPARHHRRGGTMAAPAWAISRMSWRWRRSAAARPRSASPTARTRTSASTRSAATATPTQKRRYLPKLISGEHVGALAMSEPGAGSDVVGMTTRAEKKGDRYVLNGTKMWITNGPDADTLVVYAKTDPGRRRARHHRLPRREGHEGISPGAEARQARHARLAHRGAGVRGLRGAGRERARARSTTACSVLMSGLDYERAVLAGGPLGIMQACLDAVLPYVHERKQFGQPIGEFQLMQGKLADMYTDDERRHAPMSMPWRAPATAAGPRARMRPAPSFTPPRRRPGWRSRRSRRWAATATSTISRRAACCATPSSTRSAPAPPRSAAC